MRSRREKLRELTLSGINILVKWMGNPLCWGYDGNKWWLDFKEQRFGISSVEKQ